VKKIRVDKLDRLFSEYIRRRAIQRVGGCERCLAQKHDTTREDGSTRPAYMELQCSHFWGRAKLNVRWDEDNAAGICAGCHLYLTANPEEHSWWFAEHLRREKFEMLLARANEKGSPDRKAIELYLKQKLEEIKGIE